MSNQARPTLQAVVDQAVLATAASSGWLLDARTSELRVLAVAGSAAGGNGQPQHRPPVSHGQAAASGEPNGAAVGRVLTPTGARAYVLSSGQPAALLPQPDDRANEGAGGFPGVPPSILAVPCGDDAVAVLEVVDKSGGQSFTFADIAAVSGLAAVAAAALSEGDEGGSAAAPAAPADLAAGLESLAISDPARYRDTARLIETLLGS
jgi:GAF domain-containing protein